MYHKSDLSLGHRVSKWLKLVSWKASWEPQESVYDHPHLETDILGTESAACQPAERKPWPMSHDQDLTNLERQSFLIHRSARKKMSLATEPELGSQIQINTGCTINPDLDILPTGTFTIAPVRSVSNAEQPTLFGVHDPDGQVMGTITQDRLSALYQRFCSHCNLQPPMTRPDFAQALADLIHRYKEGRKEGKYIVNQRNHWTVPEPLMRLAMEGLSAKQERFACPLNFHPSMGTYFSPFAGDNVFGASHDAYSCKWTGSSQAHPDHSPKEMQKAVRWAIGSSMQSSKPCLTTFFLPFDEGSGNAYQQWLGHPSVYKIARIPKAAIQSATTRCMENWCD